MKNKLLICIGLWLLVHGSLHAQVLYRISSNSTVAPSYILATNKLVDMPVAWTKYWGAGRVFYCSLGHHDDVFEKFPAAELLMERGMCWAADGKKNVEE